MTVALLLLAVVVIVGVYASAMRHAKDRLEVLLHEGPVGYQGCDEHGGDTIVCLGCAVGRYGAPPSLPMYSADVEEWFGSTDDVTCNECGVPIPMPIREVANG